MSDSNLTQLKLNGKNRDPRTNVIIVQDRDAPSPSSSSTSTLSVSDEAFINSSQSSIKSQQNESQQEQHQPPQAPPSSSPLRAQQQQQKHYQTELITSKTGKKATNDHNNSNPLGSDSSGDELDLETRERMLNNDLRSFRNRGFHDGYDEGKKDCLQDAFDVGYKKAFEQNFILSTLKGVAQALIIDKVNFNISHTNLSVLESMKFENPNEIESIKESLIRICRENRLEILAHYVSQMG